jgi:hypothetical protein
MLTAMKSQHYYNDNNQKPAGAAQPAAGGELNQNKVSFHHDKHQSAPATARTDSVGESKPTQAPAHTPLSTEEISTRAYYVYMNLGSHHGNDVEHWLNAESELLAERNLTRTHGYPNDKQKKPRN